MYSKRFETETGLRDNHTYVSHFIASVRDRLLKFVLSRENHVVYFMSFTFPFFFLS